jgi:leucyl-tRNA synthetase
VLELLTLMLAPMTPHIAEELWEMLGHKDGLWTVAWPSFDAARAREDEVEIPVQINGRLRGRVKVASGAREEEVVKLAQADPAIVHHLAGKRIVKKIFVPDKLLNLVVA